MEADPKLALPRGPIRAAQYVRMSTDHQKYSTENQSDTNHAYADSHGMEIVRTYSDQGISGLTFKKRRGLKQLILDVQTGRADFKVILVYDVSRWGRYQDLDASAYYEFACRLAGVEVHYCAEEFKNDGKPFSALIKSWKRAMAGEYSRELSVKVFAGQTRLARQGYMLGGFAGYGFRRLLVGQDGKPKCTLARGERKSIATDRVLLVPGPPDEIATVRLIYEMFAQGTGERRIAAILNERGFKNGFGRPWHHSAILHMLSNEKYVGNNIWNRCSCKLQSPVRRNAPGSWVRADRALPAIIEPNLFEAAQRMLQKRGTTTLGGRPGRLSNDQMLQGLKRLYEQHGYLNRALIDANRELPSADAFFRRFGGLQQVFNLIGAPHRQRRLFTRGGRPCGLSNEEMLDVLRKLLEEHGNLSEQIIRMSRNAPHATAYFTRFGSLRRAYELVGFVPDRERIRPPRIVRGTSNEALLDHLRDLLRRHGRLSKSIIDADPTSPCQATIAYRFGGLLNAYRLIGYMSNWYGERHARPHGLSDQEMLDALRNLWRDCGGLSIKLIKRTKSVPSYYNYCRRFGLLSEAYRRIGFKPTTRPVKPITHPVPSWRTSLA
jgi:DNA invertase Pin-like site-specific DNA recombinase